MGILAKEIIDDPIKVVAIKREAIHRLEGAAKETKQRLICLRQFFFAEGLVQNLEKRQFVGGYGFPGFQTMEQNFFEANGKGGEKNV